ncbi:rna polymerase ii c-terminal domain phosphatase-like 4 [Quercus suber]|uniref:protein-serine/threonine phosphatase n=1 Tax=Quercus suber TaxID=58331 RepID=A0AAW0LGK2_QUESU
MKIISERDFPQDDHYDDFDDTPEENTEETCAHLCVIRGKCVSCERVALKYVHQGMWLWLNKDEMDRIRKVESAKLLEDKKMVLVLDLDQTLVHSTEQRKCLRTPQELLQHNLRDSLFRVRQPWGMMMVKLRPFVQTFLRAASTMFEIYMCTMCTRSYALQVAEILDPENVYFKSLRITAHPDSWSADEVELIAILQRLNAKAATFKITDRKTMTRMGESK